MEKICNSKARAQIHTDHNYWRLTSRKFLYSLARLKRLQNRHKDEQKCLMKSQPLLTHKSRDVAPHVQECFCRCILFHSTALIIKVIPTLQQHMFSKQQTVFIEHEVYLYENK